MAKLEKDPQEEGSSRELRVEDDPRKKTLSGLGDRLRSVRERGEGTGKLSLGAKLPAPSEAKGSGLSLPTPRRTLTLPDREDSTASANHAAEPQSSDSGDKAEASALRDDDIEIISAEDIVSEEDLAAQGGGESAFPESGTPEAAMPDEEYEVEKTEISVGLLSGEFDDTPAATSIISSVFPEPADTPVDRPSGRHRSLRSAQARPSSADARTDAAPPPSQPSSPAPDISTEAAQPPAAELGEFEDEKTELFDSPFQRDAVVPKLSAMNGPSAGQEFLINQLRNSVGRGTNNSVMVPDLAMSRRHFEIVKNLDESYLVRDLQSANGTAINGTIIQEAELFHGDRLEAGKSTFQFLHPDQPTDRSSNRHLIPAGRTNPGAKQVVGPRASANAYNPSTKRLLNYVIYGALGLSVLLVVPIVYLLMDTPAPEQPVAQAKQPSPDNDLIALYLEGVNAVKTQEWALARQHFEQVKQRDPDFERVDQQLARISREEGNRDILGDAQALAEGGDMAQAAEVANGVGEDSVYYEQARELIRRSRTVDVDARYQQAVDAFGDDDVETAMSQVEAVLADVPEHRGALELRDKLQAAIEARREEEAAEAARVAAAARKKRDEGARAAQPKARASKSGDGLFDLDGDWSGAGAPASAKTSGQDSSEADLAKGYRLYQARNFSVAALHLSGVARKASGDVAAKAKRAASDVRAFEIAYKHADRAYGQAQWGTAIENYKKARALDKKIHDAGYFQSRLAQQLANAYAKQGMAQLRASQHKAAYSSYRSGKRLSRSNSSLRTLRQELVNKARSLYIQAANKRKSNPALAKQLCETITSMLPSDEPTHRKATSLLQTL